MLLMIALVVLSANIFFFFLLLLVTPNMHSFAPNHSTVGIGTLPQSASCNLRAAAKSKCSWWKQHLLSIGSVGKCLITAFIFRICSPRFYIYLSRNVFIFINMTSSVSHFYCTTTALVQVRMLLCLPRLPCIVEVGWRPLC